MPHRPSRRRALCRRARARNPIRHLRHPEHHPRSRTGIGRWSASDFARAMRWGIAPDDSHYLPAFPFPFYNRLERARPRRSEGVSRPPAGGVAGQPGGRSPSPSPRPAARLRSLAMRSSRALAAGPGARTRCGTAAPISSPRSAAAAIATRRAIGSARPIPTASLAGGVDGLTARPRPNITPDPADRDRPVERRRHRHPARGRADARFRFRRRRHGRNRQEHRSASTTPTAGRSPSI